MRKTLACLSAVFAVSLCASAGRAEVATYDLGSPTIDTNGSSTALTNTLGAAADWYELSFDWSAVSNDPWSAEALFALADGADIATASYYTEGTSSSSASRIDTTPRTLTWGALLTTPIPTGEDFWFLARQNGSDRQALWSNISLTLATGDEVLTSTFSGDTTGGPTFHRPRSHVGSLSPNGDAVPYETTGFSVTADGIYNLFSNDGDFDGVIFLYEDAFDPNNPLANVMGGSDWPGTSPFFDQNAELNAFHLEAGRDYFFVQTGFDNTDSGAYTVTLRSISGQIVPEPAAGAGMALLTAVLLRRKRP